MKNFKWPVAVLVFILTLGISVGAVLVRQRQMVNEPLLKRINELENVRTVELRQEDDLQVVVVQLNHVADLSLAYQELQKVITTMLKQDNYRLELVDERDSSLTEAMSAVRLALYEGEQRGNFTEINDYVASTLADLNVADHRIAIDKENIYFQMRNGDSYLYEIIAREQRGREGERV
ncbi:MAG: hypothetical protein NUK65_10735 [Firmicutes bacterium]|nr:hypothetical protein [Bacillota bacterium]